MKLFDGLISNKSLILVSIILGIFIVYPNLINTYRNLSSGTVEANLSSFLSFQLFRYVFFCLLTFILLKFNVQQIKTTQYSKRILQTLPIPIIAYGIYLGISYITHTQADCFTGILVFQFVVAWIICSFIGNSIALYAEKRAFEQEIEILKTENLQSRCDALTNQINPHFFFNSLSGLTSLIRKNKKENSLEYIDKLSEVFRYILQSEKKGLVPLHEELTFLESFSYMMEVRFTDKLRFHVSVDKSRMDDEIPVLSLLPVIDNIVVHNTINSEEKMDVTIQTNEENELLISNPIHPKIEESITNGTGLPNLAKRFSLMMKKEIRIENNGQTFQVYLPLKQVVK